MIQLSEEAENDLDGMDNDVYIRFRKHIDKIAAMPPRRHLQHGVPFFKENVGQGRIAYLVREDTIYIMRCFEHHKEYEKWLGQFK
ncbi:conserved hypothetical protein [Methanocella paludicola SANAE]|uniref:Uncharacterized protein n=1 Tax=Methanocella paludicola (strain DSM 17711 / JCM 13418 / NBRC 101707 / SANAE) TaxID=304371 RepID=D1YYZ3_METPS|nr:hypothetical protein [Methanocella paludicola]BAI61665.1 conserved hypothetical protein [Methanocella paludicola SANAE]